MKIGLDIGSTTIKTVVLDEDGSVLLHKYERHCGQIAEKTAGMMLAIKVVLPARSKVSIAVSGSAGMGFAEAYDLPFVQEVFATRLAVRKLTPETDVVIELGGEDAKILFLEGTSQTYPLEVRMNGSCAGGTGAFIDQMATLLNTEPGYLNIMAQKSDQRYTIASRCGVFAKSDIQALLNQGVQKDNIAASIFDAIVNQTVAGLAQGRSIRGNILYLGGPLTFFSELRAAFDRILQVQGTLPESSLYYVAFGATMAEGKQVDIDQLICRFRQSVHSNEYASCRCLFETQTDYDAFTQRHAKAHVRYAQEDTAYAGRVFLGIDAGSTTVKCVALNENNEILMSDYQPSGGTPVDKVRDFLIGFYDRFPYTRITASAATGYGEDLIRSAFRLDGGIVETVAHFSAAKEFLPEVNFIIDIGGQDIKCFHIHNGGIDNIFLNEACSSGCGSFLQTFANAWGFSIEDFVAKGLFAPRPVDLGSRCTVFMNSAVKQAQRDGASLENIAAGLSISVVKNAIYKVIRASSIAELGDHIVVQGGTFLNDAVLRAFEMEAGVDVIRPDIAGLMGAYGAALYAKGLAKEKSATLSAEELRDLTHTVKTTTCKMCTNHCRLTVNQFGEGRTLTSGNRCDKPVRRSKQQPAFNMFAYKRGLLARYQPVTGSRGRIGLPMGLNMYELLPFWHTLLTRLGFEVITSPESDHDLYIRGQHTIPSDTVCYPAKLMHGHIEWLLDHGIKTIFYPCMSYHFDEGRSHNHYNCPVVAYYPELLHANAERLQQVDFIYKYFGIHRKRDFKKRLYDTLKTRFPSLAREEVDVAVEDAYQEYARYMGQIRKTGRVELKKAAFSRQPVIILAGRPYHIDPQINHRIDNLIALMGAAVISEDAICDLTDDKQTNVLNQWTYHARLYSAAKAVVQSEYENVNFVQLVSFGCGMDAITTDEVRSILEQNGKVYTQLKIDEITNLDAVRIRLRSLFAASKWE